MRTQARIASEESTARDDSLLLSSAGDVLDLAARLGFLGSSAARPVRLALPSLSSAVNSALTRRVNYWLGVCGCSAAGLTSIATAILSGLYLARTLLSPTSLFVIGWRVTACSVVAGFLVKVLVVVAARMRLRRLLYNIAYHPHEFDMIAVTDRMRRIEL